MLLLLKTEGTTGHEEKAALLDACYLSSWILLDQ